jgi:hypothetical protein
MAQDKNRKQALECQGWNHAEVNRRNGIRMVAQERLPSLRWRPPVPDQVFGDRRLGDFEAKLEQLAVNAWGAPQWILLAHPSDEIAQLTLYFRLARSTARSSVFLVVLGCTRNPVSRATATTQSTVGTGGQNACRYWSNQIQAFDEGKKPFWK